MKKEFSNKIYNLNLVLIVLIVVLHSSLLKYSSGNFSIFFRIINVLCDSATPMFFALSSYLFFRNFDLTKYFVKLKSRFKSLVIPYFLWSIIFYLLYYSITKFPNYELYFNNHFDFSFSALPLNILLGNCAMTMWFVRCLIIYVILSPLIYYFLKNKYFGLIMILLSLILNLILTFSYSNPLFWLPVYLLGGFTALHYKKSVESIKHNFDIKYLVAILISIITFIFAVNYNEYSKVYYIYRCISPIYIYIIFSLIKYNDNKLKFYEYSFWIFSTHLFFVQVIKKISLKIIGSSSISLIIIFFITIIFSLLCCIISAKLTQKVLPKLYMLLVGNRKGELQ